MITSNERILSFGGPGAGKSESWLSIAERLQINKEDAIFYCIDTDRSIKRLLNTDFTHLTNVNIKECRSWESFDSLVQSLESKVREQDWIVVDFMDQTWQFVQNWFTQKTFGKEYDEYLLQVRQALKNNDAKRLEALKGWTDWNVINSTYQDTVNKLALEFNCNHYWTCKAKEYSSKDAEKEDDKELKTGFSALGFNPDGEKRNSYRMHTVLYHNYNGDGYFLTTIKDRGRKKLKNFRFSCDDDHRKFFDVYEKIIMKELPEELV